MYSAVIESGWVTSTHPMEMMMMTTNIERVDTQSLIHIIRINKPIEDVIKQLALSLKESVDYVNHISGLMNEASDPVLVYCYFKIIVVVLFHSGLIIESHLNESKKSGSPILFDIIKYNRIVSDKLYSNQHMFENRIKSFSQLELLTFTLFMAIHNGDLEQT